MYELILIRAFHGFSSVMSKTGRKGGAVGGRETKRQFGFYFSVLKKENFTVTLYIHSCICTGMALKRIFLLVIYWFVSLIFCFVLRQKNFMCYKNLLIDKVSHNSCL